jgi:diguanylate cyclase (GGDEF)-like protein
MDQQRMAAVLAEFARTLVGNFSIQEILDRLARRVIEVIPADGAGVVLLDEAARLHFVSATDERILVIEQLQLELGEGPCILSYESGEAVSVPDLATEKRFEHFAGRAIQEGLGAVYSFPLRLDGRRLGALDLYSRAVQELSAEDMVGGQVLADVAAAYIFNAQARVDAVASADALRHRALHDPLTKLPNRALLEDRLALALAKSERSGTLTGLLFVDLDRFKAVNDTYGHLVGDRLLIAVAQRLTSALRPGDTLARVAGDEFVVVCEDISDLAHAEQIASRIHGVLEAPFAITPNSITVSASVGIAVGTDPDEHAADLLLHADGALYAAKRRGGGQSESATERARTETDRRLNVERDLRHAIDTNQLTLAYQPIFGLSTERAGRVEALLRWTHPLLGEIAAPAVVASAERTGVIRDLGRWVLRTACEQLRSWREAGVGVDCISVNVAASEFTDPDYCATVEAVCAETGIEPRALCLEITESVLIDNVPGALEAFEDLKRVGVQLALDDFGTGYSSLSYLKRFPVDMVKIDQTFVAGVPTDPLDEAIVTAVVTLAHAIGMTVVAEGVEEPHQRTAIVNLGCDMAQGFLLAAPMGAADVVDCLQIEAG